MTEKLNNQYKKSHGDLVDKIFKKHARYKAEP